MLTRTLALAALLLSGCVAGVAHVEPLQGQTAKQTYSDMAYCEGIERAAPDRRELLVLLSPLLAPRHHGPVYGQCMAERGYRPLTPEDFKS